MIKVPTEVQDLNRDTQAISYNNEVNNPAALQAACEKDQAACHKLDDAPKNFFSGVRRAKRVISDACAIATQLEVLADEDAAELFGYADDWSKARKVIDLAPAPSDTNTTKSPTTPSDRPCLPGDATHACSGHSGNQ